MPRTQALECRLACIEPAAAAAAADPESSSAEDAEREVVRWSDEAAMVRDLIPVQLSFQFTTHGCRSCTTTKKTAKLVLLILQGWAKEWSLGCVKSRPVARGSQEEGFTQPRDHSFAKPCIFVT